METSDTERDTLIKVVKFLLSSSNSTADDSDSETEELSQWYDDLFKEVKKNDNMRFKSRSGSIIYLVPQLLGLLKECLLSHRWKECVEVMTGVARETSITFSAGPTILHVGAELFYQEGDRSSNQFEQLITQLKLLSDLNVKEVVLEYFMYLMTQMKTDEARMALMHIPPRTRPKLVPDREKEISEFLLKAYEGLIYYVEYLRAKQSIETMHEQSVGDPFMEGSMGEMGGSEVMSMKSAAEKATACFNVLNGRSGVWDIFVTKHVELLEFLEQPDDALTVIQTNAEKNPENPNALKQLYNYYCKHDYASAEKKEVLQAISVMNPADEAALELHEILVLENVSISNRLQLLFDLLDYQCWQDHIRPWKKLANELQIVANECPELTTVTDSDAVKELWQIRATWWPGYHFGELDIEVACTHLALFRQKSIVATLLLGIDNLFSKEFGQIQNMKSQD